MKIKLSKDDVGTILAFVAMGVMIVFTINFMARNQDQFKECERKALRAGFPDYSYIVDTKECFGKSEIKSELLYYSVDKK